MSQYKMVITEKYGISFGKNQYMVSNEMKDVSNVNTPEVMTALRFTLSALATSFKKGFKFHIVKYGYHDKRTIAGIGEDAEQVSFHSLKNSPETSLVSISDMTLSEKLTVDFIEFSYEIDPVNFSKEDQETIVEKEIPLKYDGVIYLHDVTTYEKVW